MPKKAKETVTVSKELVDTMSYLADKYATLINTELDSSINDEAVKKSLKKDLREVEKFEVALSKEVYRKGK